MTLNKKLLVAAIAVAVGFLTVNLLVPGQVWAQVKAALVRDVDHPSMYPFAKQLCAAPSCSAGGTIGNLPNSFVVPAATASGVPVKRLVINFVSGNCVGTGRATAIFLSGRPVGATTTSDTGESFSDNTFPLAVAQFLSSLSVNGVAAFATKSQIIYAPGTTVSISANAVTAGANFCKAQLNGYFVAQ